MPIKSGKKFTVTFDIDDVVELRHAMGNRGGSHAKRVIYNAIRRLIRAGKISGRGLAEEN